MKICDVLVAVMKSINKIYNLLFGKITNRQANVSANTVLNYTNEQTTQAVETPKVIKDKKIEFIKSLHLAVINGFEPFIIYTHAYHETSNFTKIIGEYNYTGLKVPSLISPIAGWKGKVVYITTHEMINGVNTKVIDKFLDFDNADDFMSFYIFQIKRLYKESYENRNNAIAYFYWLTRGKNRYATDLSYSDKLEKLYTHLKSNGEYEKVIEMLNYG